MEISPLREIHEKTKITIKWINSHVKGSFMSIFDGNNPNRKNFKTLSRDSQFTKLSYKKK